MAHVIPTDARARKRLVAYAVVVLAAAAGMWRMETTVNRLDTEINDRAATACVQAWERVEQIRAAIVIPGEAIIEVADADPERVEEFRDAVDRRVGETLADPDCDLAAAQRRLER